VRITDAMLSKLLLNIENFNVFNTILFIQKYRVNVDFDLNCSRFCNLMEINNEILKVTKLNTN
jgi:hypothetical protein